MAKGDIYEVTCEGQYYGFNNNNKVTGNYSVTAKMDENAKKAGFLSVFRNEILKSDKVMRSLYPDWKRFRTHVITDARNITRQGKPVRELQLMNKAQVIDYVNKKGLEIDTDLYPEVSELRQALKDYHEDYESFQKQQEKRRLIKGPALAVKRGVLELNPWLVSNAQQTESSAPVAQQQPLGETSERKARTPKKVQPMTHEQFVDEDDFDANDDLTPKDFNAPITLELDDDPDDVAEFDDKKNIEALLDTI